MPIISKEEFIKKQRSGKGFSQDDAEDFRSLIVGIDGVNEGLNKKGKKLGYKDYTRLVFFWLNISERLQNIVKARYADEIKNDDYNQIARLSTWLEKKDATTGLTNLEMTINCLETDTKAELMNTLNKINSVFELGLDPIIRGQSDEAKREKEKKDNELKEKVQSTLNMTEDQQKIAQNKAREFYEKLDLVSRMVHDYDLVEQISEKANSFWCFNQAKTDEEILESYQRIQKLKDFLERKEKGHDKTNFQRIRDALVEEDAINDFENYLKSINGWFNTGIDVEKLKADAIKEKENEKVNRDGFITYDIDEPEKDIIKTDTVAPKKNIINDDIFKAEKEKEIDSENAARKYEFMLNAYEDASKVAIYSDVCLGNLGFMSEKYPEIDYMMRDIKKPLEDTAKITDKTTPAMAAQTINHLREKINDFLVVNEKVEDKGVRKVYKELKNFMSFLNVKQPRMNNPVNDKSFGDILKETYPSVVSEYNKYGSNAISENAEKQQRKLLRLIKNVKKNYELLVDCNQYPEGNSKQFNAMFDAVKKAAEGLKPTSSLMEVKQLMGEVMKKASTYDHKINSMGLRGGQLGVGKKKGFYRHYAAQELVNLAVGVLTATDKAVNQYESLNKQVKPKVQKSTQKGIKK